MKRITKNNDNEDVLYPEDIAKMLRISVKTIYRKSWRIKTGIPYKKIGGRLIFSRSEIDRWRKGYNVRKNHFENDQQKEELRWTNLIRV